MFVSWLLFLGSHVETDLHWWNTQDAWRNWNSSYAWFWPNTLSIDRWLVVVRQCLDSVSRANLGARWSLTVVWRSSGWWVWSYHWRNWIVLFEPLFLGGLVTDCFGIACRVFFWSWWWSPVSCRRGSIPWHSIGAARSFWNDDVCLLN